MAVLRLGDPPITLEVVLTSGQDFIDAIRQEAGPDHPDGLAPGTPIDWPAGTKAWFVVKNRGGSEQRWDLTVDGPYLRIDVDGALVDTVALEAKARLWLEYPAEISTAGPFVWAAGPVEWGSR